MNLRTDNGGCSRSSRALAGSHRLRVMLLFLLAAPFLLRAQLPPQVPPGAQMQLQIAQPGVDVTTPVTARAEFDPPWVRAGEKVFYRVSIDATESSIEWPDEFPAAPELKLGPAVRGQITQMQAGGFRPLASFLYEVQPPVAGHFTVTNFSVNVSGIPVEVPAASLEVVETNSPAPPARPAARRLVLELTASNLFLGQPFRARVILPGGPNGEIEALREVQIIGDGLMIDKTASRQAIEPASVNGELKTAFICELVVTPIAPGPLKFFAQAFTAGREFNAPISIRGQVSLSGGLPKYVLLVSRPVEIKVRPLPTEGELPGFTGTIGRFFHDPPQLATNRLRVGEPVPLRIQFHGEGDLTRLVPPLAPRSRDWQIIADPPPATGFTLIPLSDDVRETPAIPFSYFDPETARYVDLTIPPLPVTVLGDGLPTELPVFSEAGKAGVPLKLSGMAPAPGKAMSSLKPLQMQGWFAVVQMGPVIGFLALWRWDRRRRFLEAHPEIVRRTQARRALRREKQQLQKAVDARDTSAFIRHAVRAMSIAVAPHFPANPQALVSGDVLEQMDEPARTGRAGETVKLIFAAADAQFSHQAQTPPDLAAWPSEVAAVLQQLEAKL